MKRKEEDGLVEENDGWVGGGRLGKGMHQWRWFSGGKLMGRWRWVGGGRVMDRWCRGGSMEENGWVGG